MVPLTPKALEILAVLVKNNGELVSKEELMKAAWPDTFVEEGSLTQNISLLRKALGPDADGRPYIETMAKRGYRFAAQVRQVESNGSKPDAVPVPGRLRRRTAVVAALTILAAAGGIALYLRLGGRPSQVRSLAVLPLENHSGDSGQDYFADGLTEVLTGDLAKIRTLRVVSRTSAMHYKKTTKRAPEIARELKVDALVEGSVARSGDRVQVRVQLIRGSTDEHLWSESYEREVKDVLLLQSEVALAIAREIQARLSPEEQARFSGRRPVNRDAFDAYLRGRHSWNERTPAAIHAAIGHFRAAIQSDPAYAPAYAGLADCYNQLGTVIVGERPPSETRPMAVAAARKALEIDNGLAEAHAALAYTDLYNWNWTQAEQGFRKAIELNPSYASAHLWYAHYLAARGRFNEALQEVHTARDLDPLSPIIATQVGWVYHKMGRQEEAIAEYRKVLESYPEYIWAHWQIGLSLSLQSRHDQAVAALEKAGSLSGRNPSMLGSLAWAYGRAGERTKALKLLEELRELARRRYVSPAAFESVFSGLGDLDRQFEYLEKSYRERCNCMAYFAVNPGRERVHADPRGQELLRRLGLSQ
ncbi:MAG: winged helix-turn-helix domain-containing protein [Bryobacterales bacterium]|nr:winged helix-turn-helix domain-containing protein [Bryobacterales bacterium]